jgi:translation initiation factor 6 (eIF-6)
MAIYKTDFFGNSTLGLLSILTNTHCYLPPDLKKKQIENISRFLEVETVTTTFYNTFLLGLLGAGNSKFLFIPGIVSDKELINSDIKVFKINSVFNTFGNLILCNDKGIILSPYLSDKIDFFKENTKLDVEITTISGLPLPGILALVSNKAGIAHKNCRDKELEVLEKTLGVEFKVCEFYEGFPGAEFLANSKGLIIPKYIKSQELAEIQEGLKVF